MARTMQTAKKTPKLRTATVTTLHNVIRKDTKEDKAKAELILQNQPDLNLNELVKGATVLITASSLGQTKVVKAILSRHDIDVNARFTGDGTTALMWAACGVGQKFVATTQALLNHANVDVNLVDERLGYTALMFAVRQMYADTVKLLIQHPATDIYLKCKEGRTALSYALHLDVDFHRDTIVGLFIQHSVIQKSYSYLSESDLALLLQMEKNLGNATPTTTAAGAVTTPSHKISAVPLSVRCSTLFFAVDLTGDDEDSGDGSNSSDSESESESSGSSVKIEAESVTNKVVKSHIVSALPTTSTASTAPRATSVVPATSSASAAPRATSTHPATSSASAAPRATSTHPATSSASTAPRSTSAAPVTSSASAAPRSTSVVPATSSASAAPRATSVVPATSSASTAPRAAAFVSATSSTSTSPRASSAVPVTSSVSSKSPRTWLATRLLSAGFTEEDVQHSEQCLIHDQRVISEQLFAMNSTLDDTVLQSIGISAMGIRAYLLDLHRTLRAAPVKTKRSAKRAREEE